MKYIKIIILLLVSNSLFGQQVLLQGGTKGGISRTTRGDTLLVGSTKVRDNNNPLNTAFDLQNYNRYLGPALYRVINNSGDANIVLLGDSKIEQDIIPNAFKRLLNERWEFDGPGFWQIAPTIRQSRTAASHNDITTANWTLKSFGTGRGLPVYSLLSTGSSVPFYWLGQNSKNTPDIWTNLEVWYYGQAGGANLTIEIDSIVVGTINTSLLTGFQRVTYTVAERQHSVKVTPSGAGAEILGFKTYRTSSNTVSTHRIGHTGAKASDYLAVDSSLWNPQLRALSPDIVFLYLGANERAAGTSTAAFKTSMHSMIVRLRQAKPTMDICLIGQSDVIGTFGTPTATTAQYNDQLRQLAIEDSCSYFDIQQIFGMYAQANAKGLFSIDGIHEGPIGGNLVASNIINSVPVFNRSNLKDQFQTLFGFATPVNASSQTANRILLSNSSGSVVTNTYFQTDVTNSSAIFGADVTAAGKITATTSLQAAAPPYTGGPMNIGGNRASIGYFGFATGQEIFTAGFSGGIRMDAAHNTIRFQATNQGAAVDAWKFESFLAIAYKQFSGTNQSLINLGWGVEGIQTNRIHSLFKISTDFNQTSAVTSARVFGFDFRPSTTSLNGIKLAAFTNTIGDNFFNSTSGNTGFGLPALSSSPSPTARLHIGAGTATASTAPLKLTTTSAVLNTTPEAGAIEVGASDNRMYYTGSSATRNTLAYLSDLATIGTFQASGNSNGLTLSGTDIRLHAATISTPGAVNVGQQTFGVSSGTKLFNGTGSYQIDVDGDTDNTPAGITFTQLGGADQLGFIYMNSADASNASFRLSLEEGGLLTDQFTIGTLNDTKGITERGGLYEDVTTVTTSPYTVIYGDRNVYLDGTSITVNLQAIGTSTAETKIGRVIYFFNDNATSVTLTPNGSETINDASSLVLPVNTGVTLLAVTGTQWVVRN